MREAAVVFFHFGVTLSPLLQAIIPTIHKHFLISVTAAHHCGIDEHWLLDILPSIFFSSISQGAWGLCCESLHKQWIQTHSLHLKSWWISADMPHILDCVSQERWALSSLPGQKWTVTEIHTFTHKHQEHLWVTLLLCPSPWPRYSSRGGQGVCTYTRGTRIYLGCVFYHGVWISFHDWLHWHLSLFTEATSLW